MLKHQLLHPVALHKPPKEYVMDELACAHGHTVLRLLPYHSFTIQKQKSYDDIKPVSEEWQQMKVEDVSINLVETQQYMNLQILID
ncbi:hypothetical protein Trydic_g17243 [Trypoxylus dichotomus]